MMEKIDKRDRAGLFRERLAQAMADKGESQSGLARKVGVDRSTISQLLGGEGARLPNAQVVAECASALDISADWLLGLTERPERLANLLATSLTLTEAPRALIDETIFGWHQEAAGYKVRHVPATLPDMLKTREMLRWEYEPQLGRSAEQAIGASEDRLRWMRSAQSDYEIALPQHELFAFARAEGYYAGLPLDTRLAQIDRLGQLCDQLYPRLRIYVFDARRVFSAPVTVFGPLLAAIYLGRHYVAFRDSQRVGAITQHFDWLVREADTGARDFTRLLNTLRAEAKDSLEPGGRRHTH
ncbi:helix-turn-helix domain-containing protein [Defluviimonas sp. WL0002]|uniref:Helix-turn-helix domain-containing protein n=1 Tax=Albidovulum marisflavi TaxID=2984159 RepID=A0ABT2ZDH5_9RHOB|nr:helix-turn-helix transcriptional regulator [Defluviimonas sp. WL0002]MCV2868801.1 helix-turn-helix domain-containing protein [Defluviimonas sp. WL0002]